ncbi:MAG: hypothetical protein J5548_04995 [Prevotella sp.]|nr:hypothetical protein [Prevotella sp.]
MGRDKRMTQKSRWGKIPIHHTGMAALLPYLVIFVMGMVLTLSEYNYLARVEEQNLFLHTPLFFSQSMVVPGGLLSWAGAFLTQMLHYPALGVAVFCLLLGLLVFLLGRAFHIPEKWMCVTLIPVTMLLLGNVDLGYWIYYLKLRGYFFVPTLGVISAAGMVWTYRALPCRFRTVFLLLTVAGFYPLMGIHALLAAFLMAVLGWRLEDYGKAQAAVDTLVALLAIVAVPLLYYRHLYHQTHLDNIYWAALPVFRMRMESFPAYHIPFAVTVASLVVMALCYRQERVSTSCCEESQEDRSNQSERSTYSQNGWLRKASAGWLQGLMIVTLAVVLAVFWYKDGNFHREIAMRRLVDQCDWEGVLKIAKNTPDEPTRDMWLMKNLALTRTGRIGEEMFDYRNGAKPANTPLPTRLVHWDGKMLYFQYGIPNYCLRWCMEDGVEYGWRVEYMKLMVKCFLANKEMDAAQKYISLLKKTLFHRKWALKYEEYIHNPQLAMHDEELLPVLQLLGDENYLSGDNAMEEQFLIDHFAGSESENPFLQELALLSAMQMHAPQLFWLRFNAYMESHPSEKVPIVYQQAACLFGEMDDKLDVGKMPLDKAVVESCRSFMETYKQYLSQGLSARHIKPLMRARYETTYYYDFFFNHYHETCY